MKLRRVAIIVVLTLLCICVCYLVFKPLSGAWGSVADICSRVLTSVFSSLLTYLLLSRDSTEPTENVKAEKPKAKTKTKTEKTKTKGQK